MNNDFAVPYMPRMASQPLAKLFVEMYGDHFVWCYDRGILMTYIADREDSRWAHDACSSGANYDRLHDNVGAFLAEMVEKYNEPRDEKPAPDKFVGKQLYDFKYAADVARHVRVMLKDRVRYAETFNVNPDTMGLPKAQKLNLLTGKIEPMQLSDRLDRRTVIMPDANCPTPNFDEFLRRITLDDSELSAYILRHAGYGLTGHCTEECLDFWLGELAGNGKTTLANIFQRIWRHNSYYTTLNFLGLADSTNNGDEMQMRTIGGLVGMRLAVAMEAKKKVQIDQALFNKLTSTDWLRGKFLFENSFEFRNTAKIIVGSNYEPMLLVDGASKRRLHLVPFNARFLAREEFTGAPGTFLKDGAFAHKLEAELPGIFHKIVLGCLEWRERGLDAPAAVLSRTAEYWGKVDIVGEWEREHKAESEFFASTKELYRSFEKFMDGRGKVMRPEDFGEEIRRRGYKSARPTVAGKREHGYLGLKP